ncbi:MAG: polysaccharide deacetylase family protein, partial [Deltaproteobacteria bacterium]|nr:polysaccharide deacetylase family protein [Deltaproteobacteria bacterium]
YHRLAPGETYQKFTGDERSWSVPVERFDEQMKFLSESGMHQASPEEIMQFIEGGNLKNDENFIVTFDDGCESVYGAAFPIMKRYGIKPLIFVTADCESRVFRSGENPQRRLSDAEIVDLSEYGAVIGSHGLRHIALTEASGEEIAGELDGSRAILSRITGKDTDFFAIPFNIYNDEVIRRALKTYKAVFVSNPGTVKRDTCKGMLPRMNVEGSLGLDGFRRLFTPSSVIKRKTVQALKRIPVKVFGARRWLAAREKIFSSPAGRLINMRNLLLLAGFLLLTYAVAAAYSLVKILETILRI